MAKDKANAKTAKAVEALMKPGTKPGRYSAGSNLYLLVGKADGQRSWTWVYRWHGKLTACGLGSAFEVALGDARKAANACRAQLDAGIKPGSPDGTEPGKAPTFGEIADQVIEAKAKGWKGDGSRKRWVYALSRRRDDDGKIDGSGFCQKLVNRPVNMVGTQDVVDVLTPIWLTKRKSASLLRVQIEAVLGAATALNHRTGDNPATLARLKDLLPKQDTSVKHHAAHPYQTAPAFVAKLRADGGTGADVLEFCILTWTRTDETRVALRSEIDRENALWIIPAHRTKKNREHRIPLSARALAIVDATDKTRPAGNPYLFPGTLPGQPISTSPLPDTMARLGAGAYTVHGWRSCARDWAGETTAHPSDIAEAALAHARRDKTHAAYQRGDLLEKRRKLMDDWAHYLEGKPATKAKPALRRRRVIFRRRPALPIAA